MTGGIIAGSVVHKATLNNIAISVSDLNRSIEWYTRVLGFTLAGQTEFPAVEAKVAFLKRPGLALELLKVPSSYRLAELDAQPPAHLRTTGFKAMVFDVDDLDAATKEFKEQNVTIVWEKQLLDPNTGLTSTMVKDPDGNMLNFFQRLS